VSEEQPIAVTPELRAAQRWNVVWVVPILALLIGGWMLYRNVSSKGPEVRIRFQTAEGIFAGKTELRCRSVSVGKVTSVELAEDLQSVFVYCTLDSGNEHLLRKGTRFWVVRPRVSAADISGLGTLLTGVYIELEPGTGALGLEALSRGAAQAVFVESGATAQALLRANIARMQAEATAHVIRRDATALGLHRGAACTLVFLDPPYGKALGEAALAAALAGGWLAPGAMIVWEEGAAPTPPVGCQTLDQRRYGDTVVTLLRAPG
jgi:16S rRNA (guanine966-N2)-methyltransferase